MNLVRVGHHVINLNQVVRIDLSFTRNYQERFGMPWEKRLGVQITFTSTCATKFENSVVSESETLFFPNGTPEAESMRRFFGDVEVLP